MAKLQRRPKEQKGLGRGVKGERVGVRSSLDLFSLSGQRLLVKRRQVKGVGEVSGSSSGGKRLFGIFHLIRDNKKNEEKYNLAIKENRATQKEMKGGNGNGITD